MRLSLAGARRISDSAISVKRGEEIGRAGVYHGLLPALDYQLEGYTFAYQLYPARQAQAFLSRQVIEVTDGPLILLDRSRAASLVEAMRVIATRSWQSSNP